MNNLLNLITENKKEEITLKPFSLRIKTLTYTRRW